jgi:beta-aspartyl-peptidase (threonine type)
MDAIIVDGATLAFGAVAALRNLAHPVAVARHVMEKTPHALLVGEGAGRFAKDQCFPFVPTERLRTQRPPAEAKGTVGAVAFDQTGHVAAATSTGGMRGQMAGRVGDSALIGCGAIAEDGIGGVSATGHGEAIMRVMLARDAAERLRKGVTPRDAAHEALARLEVRTNSTAGLILLDAAGRHGLAHTTPHMACARIGAEGSESGMAWQAGAPV